MPTSMQAEHHNQNSKQPLPYDLFWADMAEDEITHLALVLGEFLQSAHHVGSTAIPHIKSIPVIDLLLVIKNENDLFNATKLVQVSGYSEISKSNDKQTPLIYTKPDPETGETLFQLFFYLEGADAIERNLALTKYLVNHPDQSRAYEQIKADCTMSHPENQQAYQQCKINAMQDILSAALTYK